jgi:transcriptional regulator with XRE-family HTH domain
VCSRPPLRAWTCASSSAGTLRGLRLAKGFTQVRFAEVSGFTQQYVSGLEQGRRNPTVVTLYHLAQALRVSHVELIMPDEEALRETAKAPKRKSGRP